MKNNVVGTAIFLIGCSGCSGSQSADLALRQEAEAAAAAAAKDQSAPGYVAGNGINPADGTSDNEELIKTFLNVNLELCADVLRTRPLPARDTAEVICQEYRGRPDRVTYTLDLANAKILKVER